MTFLERLGRLLRALGAAGVLAGLLAGLPYLLLHYAQQFRPEHLPDLDEITVWASNPLSEFLLLQLLYCLCWVLWAYLLLQTARELCWHAVHFAALLSEIGPDAVAFTARRTIAGLLVGAIVLAIATSLRSTPAHRSNATLADWSSPITATAPADPSITAPPTPSTAPAPAAARTQAPGACTVGPGDTLWDLAERHLDNPLRWREIYELNKMLPQSDGRHLSDPDRVYPGWTMLLPGTPQVAITSPVQPATPSPPPSTSTVPLAPAPPQAAPSAEAPSPASGTRQTAEPTRAATPHEASDPGIQLPSEAGYFAVTVAVALSAAAVRRTLRRRRDYRPGDPASQDQPRPEETALVAAMRRITRLHPDASTDPAGPPVPVGDFPFATRGARQHGLLDLLTGHQHPMLTLAGPGADDAARALLASALTTAGRARLLLPRSEVTRLAPGLTDRQLAPCHLAADLEEALGVLEEELLRRARLHQDNPRAVDGHQPGPLVLLARHDPRQHQRLSALLKAGRTYDLAAILLTDVTLSQADGLACHVEANGNATTNGTPPSDRLRIFHLPMRSAEILLSLIPENDQSRPGDHSPTNNSTSPVVPGPDHGEASPLVDHISHPDGSEIPDNDSQRDTSPGPEAGEALGGNSNKGELFSESVFAHAPAPVGFGARADEVSGSEGTPQAAAVSGGGTVATLAAPCAVAVCLLGPLTVTALGQVVTRGLAGYSGELFAYLASHPAGSTKDAILEAVWPEKDPGGSGTEAFHTAKKSVRGALRTALGATTSLSVFLHAGGLWRLDPALITTDLEDFHAAVRRATAATDPAERLAAHRCTVELYHGELCEGMDRAWLTAPREDARRRTLNALGALATSAADPEEALGLLERALEHDPYNEQLHLRLARLHTSLGRAEAVRRTQERLHRRLAEIDERPTPGTTRAFQDLLNPNPATSHPVPGRPAPHRPGPAAPKRQPRP
ncbi:BTAD domain-containing putative transcriptional regulator [Kitasatospora azatica]|uniref:BTAD domain-containing putative transcriptional regulator n=1 Tax=Kitasatospora azatica TaxID=58347 RepID=UPI0005625FD3|nr:BTAD domain-containing putative transcriptional regulator [Kitasatospora azatica]